MTTQQQVEQITTSDDFLTVEQAAKRANISTSAMYQACQDNRVAHYRLSGKGRRGKILIRPADLNAFIESCRVEAGASSTCFKFTHRRG